MARSKILHGDCLARLRSLPANSVDALVTDPPAGIGFMARGKDHWDSDKGGRDHWIAWLENVMRECYRVLKPGAHGLVWALPRTSHWTATALENAGFEVRDVCVHVFGSGFPKSLDVSKAIDRAAGAKREVVGYHATPGHFSAALGDGRDISKRKKWIEKATSGAVPLTAPATDAAKRWQGFGSALKPAHENWILVRKPLERGLTISQNVLKHGCGALAIDASRIGHNEVITAGKSPKTPQAGWDRPWRHNPEAVTALAERKAKNAEKATQLGRWPANLVLSPDAARELDRQSGTRKTGKHTGKRAGVGYRGGAGTESGSFMRPANEGGVSRYFYVCKPSRRERNLGCEGMPKVHARGMGVMKGNLTAKTGDRTYVDRENHHPCVKPITLMRYLIRMVTPPGGTVLDCFAGSGTTLCAARREGFAFIGIEQDASYVAIARARIRAARPARAPEARA